MKIVDWKILQDQGGYSQSTEFLQVREMIERAIQANDNPPGTGRFLLRPRAVDQATGRDLKKQAGVTVNGVVPIKKGFIDNLRDQGWQFEKSVHPGLGKCDAVFDFRGEVRPFIVEWETGNISSSHRAANRILMAILDGHASGGVVVLPSKDMYLHLTDRIGNLNEMEPYFDLYRKVENLSSDPFLFGFVVVEQDGLSSEVPYFKGGRDGLAQKRAREAQEGN
ncbi:hypothetical protein [Corynebacterium cystitidis]|uniref:Restriction endonuclease BamHI n=1 Tax=Corynebacterium cystitidis DSM 20524 TaxID=1121357 RepID=A0A1H9WMJ8_9CORY|nr:hypothetical protein [Corynebacterium cystitidis]WJY82836.1 Type-2 restriction enzyme BamHI [Corynebacterium cystitidis DSM 20524]SES35074.1 Restriction endonuclease BamHI [Corynebacterium cystitidis DSM 20524]SNV69988.1 Type-2 restriction enzyme BamHI [Corynebacterium cystitidis]